MIEIKPRLRRMRMDGPFVYKIVSNWNRELGTGKSATIKRGICSLEYKMHEKTSGLTKTVGVVVYKDLKDALDHDLQVYGSEVALLRCKYTGALKVPLKELWKAYEDLWWITNAHDLIRLLRNPCASMYLSSKTYCVRSVTPVGVVRVWSKDPNFHEGVDGYLEVADGAILMGRCSIS